MPFDGTRIATAMDPPFAGPEIVRLLAREEFYHTYLIPDVTEQKPLRPDEEALRWAVADAVLALMERNIIADGYQPGWSNYPAKGLNRTKESLFQSFSYPRHDDTYLLTAPLPAIRHVLGIESIPNPPFFLDQLQNGGANAYFWGMLNAKAASEQCLEVIISRLAVVVEGARAAKAVSDEALQQFLCSVLDVGDLVTMSDNDSLALHGAWFCFLKGCIWSADCLASKPKAREIASVLQSRHSSPVVLRALGPVFDWLGTEEATTWTERVQIPESEW